MMELAVVSIVVLYVLSALQTGRGWAHGLRSFAVVLSLWSGWSVWQGEPLSAGATWMASFRSVLAVDSVGAGLLVLLTFWSLLAHLLMPARCRTADVAAAGACLVVIDGGLLLAVAGCGLLAGSAVLAAAIDGQSQVARRRLGLSILALQALIAAVWLPTTVPVLLVSAALLGVWPLTLWFEGGRHGTAAASHRLPAAVAALALIGRHVDLPAQAIVGLALLTLLSVASALLVRPAATSMRWLQSGKGTLLIAAALVDPTAAVWMLAAWGSAELVGAFVHERIERLVPEHSLADTGGLAPILTGVYRLAVAATVLAFASPPILLAAWRLAPLAHSAAGPIAVVAVGCLLALPSLPMWRLTLVTFRGEPRQTTAPEDVSSQAPLWVLSVAVAAVGLAPVGAAVLLDQMPSLTEAFATAVAPLVLLPIGAVMLWWSPRPAQVRVPSRFTTATEQGLAVTRIADAIGGGLQTAARFAWTAIDGVLAGGIPSAVMFLLRLLSWLIARIHDRRSDWALATIIGTSLILLWSWRGGQG